MEQIKYKQMSRKELKEYCLTNRHDIEALREYMARPGEKSRIIPPGASSEEITSVILEVLDS